MRALCWAVLTMSAMATGAAWWSAWHYQSVVIAIVASHGCWVTYQAVRAVIESHKLTCKRCNQWYPELMVSWCCERCFCESFEKQKSE